MIRKKNRSKIQIHRRVVFAICVLVAEDLLGSSEAMKFDLRWNTCIGKMILCNVRTVANLLRTTLFCSLHRVTQSPCALPSMIRSPLALGFKYEYLRPSSGRAGSHKLFPSYAQGPPIPLKGPKRRCMVCQLCM